MPHFGHIFKPKGDERVVMTLKRHPIIIFRIIGEFILLAIIPLVVLLLLNNFRPGILSGPLIYPLILVCSSIYFLAIWLFFFTAIIDYYLDLWIITSERILNIEQEGLFARTIAELDLYKIQDVTSEVKGIFRTLLNFGNVFVQTAGEKERFVFEQVPDPHLVRRKIIELIETDRAVHRH